MSPPCKRVCLLITDREFLPIAISVHRITNQLNNLTFNLVAHIRMSSIADSNAILDKKRLLSQHQAVITLIHDQVVKPHVVTFEWLDLCCGQGQIIANLEDSCTEEQRSKILFHIQDINEDYLKITERKAVELKFRNVETYPSDIAAFPSLILPSSKFQFITLLNAIHEIPPLLIPEILLESIIRLNSKGSLYVYDMESIKPLELGAISWSREEIQEIVNCVLLPIAEKGYSPHVNRWHHSSTIAWSLKLEKEYLKAEVEIEKELKKLKTQGVDKIIEVLKRKFESCKLALESYTKYGAETQEDQEKRDQLLYEYYSINRILITVNG